MKKIAALLFIAVFASFLAGCYSTSCRAPSYEHMNVKGEG